MKVNKNYSKGRPSKGFSIFYLPITDMKLFLSLQQLVYFLQKLSHKENAWEFPTR